MKKKRKKIEKIKKFVKNQIREEYPAEAAEGKQFSYCLNQNSAFLMFFSLFLDGFWKFKKYLQSFMNGFYTWY